MGQFMNWVMGDPAGAMEKAAKKQAEAINKQTEAIKNQPIITEAPESNLTGQETALEMGGVDEQSKAAKRRKSRVDLMNQGRTRTGGLDTGLLI